jgi:hypothetical protein
VRLIFIHICYCRLILALHKTKNLFLPLEILLKAQAVPAAAHASQCIPPALKIYTINILISCLAVAQARVRARTHTHTHTHTHGKIPLNECSAHRKDRSLQNAQRTQETNIHGLSTGFEPSISAIKWHQTYVLDRTATGIG